MTGFFEKLLQRADKLTPENLQAAMNLLARERGFLDAIFRNIQEGVIVLDSEEKLLFANQAAGKLVGFDVEQQRKRPMGRFLREWELDELFNLRKLSGGWESLAAREVEVLYPEHRFVSVYAVPMDSENGAGANLLLILRDVTGERERETSALETERSNAVKQLAAGVAHEIGNPLNAINLHLQLLARDLSAEAAFDEETKRHYAGLVNVAKSEVARLDAIIRQFLGALRPRKTVLRPEQPAEVLKESLEVLKTQLENRRISVSLETPSQIPLVGLDRDQIKQVFFNLVKNAMEAMPDGGLLRIVFHVTDSSVEISVADNGKGIPSDELGHIFEPYHTTKAGGNGLGLMIVKRIIDAHGGEIEVASKPGGGTCFKIRLPRTERRIRRIGGLQS